MDGRVTTLDGCGHNFCIPCLEELYDDWTDGCKQPCQQCFKLNVPEKSDLRNLKLNPGLPNIPGLNLQANSHTYWKSGVLQTLNILGVKLSMFWGWCWRTYIPLARTFQCHNKQKICWSCLANIELDWMVGYQWIDPPRLWESVSTRLTVQPSLLHKSNNGSLLFLFPALCFAQMVLLLYSSPALWLQKMSSLAVGLFMPTLVNFFQLLSNNQNSVLTFGKGCGCPMIVLQTNYNLWSVRSLVCWFWNA